MFSQQQCEIARTLTKDKALDEQINSEYQTMTPADKVNSAIVSGYTGLNSIFVCLLQ